MANHKRRKPKNSRAGCLLCKPHKANGAKNCNPVSAQRQLQDNGLTPDHDSCTLLDMEHALETVFLRPGTKVFYSKKGKMVIEEVLAEVEVPFLRFGSGDSYVITWKGVEANASEPEECLV